MTLLCSCTQQPVAPIVPLPVLLKLAIGARNAGKTRSELNHARHGSLNSAPRPARALRGRIALKQLWQTLGDHERRQVVLMLGRLVAKQLDAPPADEEVACD